MSQYVATHADSIGEVKLRKIHHIARSPINGSMENNAAAREMHLIHLKCETLEKRENKH